VKGKDRLAILQAAALKIPLKVTAINIGQLDLRIIRFVM
jgi:hypothetical protein